MTKAVMCYKTIEPTYYNKGTEYEKSCDKFLAYYSHKTVADLKVEAERLNTEKPELDGAGNPIDWTKVNYFFVHEQAEMY